MPRQTTVLSDGNASDLREYFGEFGEKSFSTAPDEPKPSGLSAAKIIEIALECRKLSSYNVTLDFNDFLIGIRGECVYNDFWNPNVGKKAAINILATGRFMIYLSSNVSKKVNNFSMAHELGHYFIHFLRDEFRLAFSSERIEKENHMRAYRFGYEEVEQEANIFAAAFLMPPDIFQQKWGSERGNLTSLSEFFLVEEYTVMKWREKIDKLYQDGLIGSLDGSKTKI